MSNKKYILLFQGIFFSVPLITFAAVDLSWFEELLDGIGDLIGAAVPIVIGLAVLLFLWGLAVYIMNQDQPEARIAARQRMIWGIVIIFVMVSLWGLVAFLGEVTDVDPEDYDTVDLIPDI